MLPKEAEEIKNLLLHKPTVVQWSEYRGSPAPVGFGAVTYEWPNKCIEVGAVVVDKKYRGQGYGHAIVKGLIGVAKAEYPESTIFALCNEKSLNLFLDNGAKIITDPGILPEEVFGECVKCPKFQEAKAQGKLCCDIPVMIQKAGDKNGNA
jgi:N-acetylglutamate synthase-like GNAT family acetyltransferase